MKVSFTNKSTWACLAALAGASLVPLTASAAELQLVKDAAHPADAIHKKVELFGSLRLSLDYADSDVSRTQAKTDPLFNDGGTSISSNTSQIGIRGQIPINKDYWMLFQYDQQVDIDDIDPDDVLTNRPSFLGLRSPMGTILVGRINTLFKSVGVSYLGYFNTSVGDSHAILGASSGGATRLDLQAANSITWSKRFGTLSVSGQYSADQQGSIGTVDDNDRESYAGSINWNPGPLDVTGVYIHFADWFGVAKVDAYRATAKYRMGPTQIGVVYENIDADANSAAVAPVAERISRAAYGAQLNYTFMPRWTAVAQWNHAEASDAGNDSADQYTVGVFHPVNKQLIVHAMYTTTHNDDNAAYRGVDYAHGDKLGTLPGHNPQAISLGAQLLF